MPEGPFGNVEIIGPRRDNHLVIVGIHIGKFSKLQLIENINSEIKSNIEERDVISRDLFEHESDIASRTVTAIDLGEEADGSDVQTIIKQMFGVEFTTVEVVVGDKEIQIDRFIER